MPRSWIVLSFVGLPSLLACGDKEADDSGSGGGGGGGLTYDIDGDGYAADVDCNDDLAIINPGATEVCNSVDDDCDGEVDEGVLTRFYTDADLDGYGDEYDYIDLCNQQPGQITAGGDCRDDDATVNPSADEFCDGIDNNCDGAVDEDLIVDLYDDADGDGYGRDSTATRGCPDGVQAEAGGDCDDDDPSRYPGAPEYCGDGLINDCAGDKAAAADACSGDLTGNDIALDLGTAFTGQSGDFAGYGVANAGDVDGDGQDDILVGSPGNNSNTGAAYLVAGGTAAGKLSTQATATFLGESSGALVGYKLSDAGDVDRDGYDDILLGAWGTGMAYLVRGPVVGTHSLSSADVRLIGDAGAATGYSMSPAGDINDDGWPDVLFGAYLDSSEATSGGATYVFYGPVSDSSRAITAADAILAGETDNTGSSLAIAGGGDLNGDGVDDLAISAPYITAPDGGTGSEGVVHLVYGPVTAGDAILETRADVTLYGQGYQDFVGTSMDVGDFNGDGLDDLLVSAINSSDYAGRALVVYGDTTRAGEGTLADVAGGSVSPLGTPIYVESYFAASTGDLNGDGRDDLILGAPYLSYGALTNGSSYVFHGPISGTQTTAAAALRVRSPDNGTMLGMSVAGAGDFDGDTHPDVLVGAPGASVGGSGVVISFIGDGTY